MNMLLGRDRTQAPGNARRLALATGLVLAGSALLYGYSLAPDLLWGDDAMYQRVLATGAWDIHPVWGVLAPLFARLPWGSLAFRANLASAVYAVGAVLFLFLSAYELTRSVRAALSAGAIFAVSHLFWLESVRAEVYTLQMLLFFGGLWAFLHWRQAPDRWLWLLLGLLLWWVGTVNHLLLALSLPGGLVLLLSTFSASRHKKTLLLALLVLAIVGVLVALLTFDFSTIVLDALRNVLHSTPLGISPRRLAWHVMILAYQFPAFVLLAIPGVRYLWRHDRTATLAIGLMALFPALFAATYGSLESYVLYLPALGLVALLAGVGVAVATARWPPSRWLLVGVVLIGLQVGLYRITPLVVDRVAPGLMPSRNLPGRQASSFFLWPPKRGYHGARQFSEAALAVLPADTMLVTDWTIYAPLRYLQDVEGQRPDVTLVPVSPLVVQTVRENAGHRPLFLANADPRYYPISELEEHFQMRPVGPIFGLLPLEGEPPPQGGM